MKLNPIHILLDAIESLIVDLLSSGPTESTRLLLAIDTLRSAVKYLDQHARP